MKNICPEINEKDPISDIFKTAYHKLDQGFIFIIDEWDYIFNRNSFCSDKDKENFLALLENLTTSDFLNLINKINSVQSGSGITTHLIKLLRNLDKYALQEGIITQGFAQYVNNNTATRETVKKKIMPHKLSYNFIEDKLKIFRKNHIILAEYSLHEFRHTFRTELERLNVKQVIINSILGHKTAMYHWTYIHI